MVPPTQKLRFPLRLQLRLDLTVLQSLPLEFDQVTCEVATFRGTVTRSSTGVIHRTTHGLTTCGILLKKWSERFRR